MTDVRRKIDNDVSEVGTVVERAGALIVMKVDRSVLEEFAAHDGVPQDGLPYDVYADAADMTQAGWVLHND